MCELTVKLSNGKEVLVTEDVLGTVYKYMRFSLTLEELARELGLESWEEAYDFVKRFPVWVAWTPPSFFRYIKEKLCVEKKSVE